LTNLEFVHNAPQQLSPNLITLRSTLKQVYAKGTNIDALQGTSWVAGFLK
jgi:hypothetical protein